MSESGRFPTPANAVPVISEEALALIPPGPGSTPSLILFVIVIFLRPGYLRPIAIIENTIESGDQ